MITFLDFCKGAGLLQNEVTYKDTYGAANFLSATPRISTGWSCFINGKYRNLFRKPLGCKHGCPGNNCRFVQVMSREDGDHWAYWSYTQNRFTVVEKEEKAFELAFPYGAHKEVTSGQGEIHKTVVTEVEPPD